MHSSHLSNVLTSCSSKFHVKKVTYFNYSFFLKNASILTFDRVVVNDHVWIHAGVSDLTATCKIPQERRGKTSVLARPSEWSVTLKQNTCLSFRDELTSNNLVVQTQSFPDSRQHKCQKTRKMQ